MMSSLSCGCASVATCCQPQPPQPSRACTHGGVTRAGDASRTSTTRPRRWSARSAVTSMRHPLAGKRTVDERDPAVVGPSQRVAAGNHPRRRQLHRTSQAQNSARLAHCETWSSDQVKSLRVHELGEPEQVMVLEERPEPEVRPGDVRLRVHAAALNFPDVLMCRGEYQVKPPVPFTPGAEVAGVIEEVGEGVEGFGVGDRVLAIPNFGNGGFAESTTASAGAAGRGVPDPGIDAVRGGGRAARRVPDRAISRCTGARTSSRARRLLVHAGAGGVGSAAIQLGLAAGARVIATAGGPDKVEVCRKLGVASRARLPRARLRRRGEGVHRRPRRRRDLRPGRRRHLRPFDEVHRVRGPHPDHRIHRRPFRRGAHESRADQELLGRRRALGAVQRDESRSSCARRTTSWCGCSRPGRSIR